MENEWNDLNSVIWEFTVVREQELEWRRRVMREVVTEVNVSASR